MIYLLLSILSSALIYLVFKLLGKYKIDTLNALMFNYLTAFILGFFLHPGTIEFASVFSENWFWGSVVLGVLFITVFNFMVITTQQNGISVVSVASKMSVVLSITFVIFYYNEKPGMLKITGIVLGLLAVYLVSVKRKKGLDLKKSDLLLPFLVFVGSGIVESSIKFLETSYVAQDEVALFSAFTFLSAAFVGIIIMLVRFLKQSAIPKLKDCVGGILLGIPNYGSIYFFIKALRNDMTNSSTVFILNNIAIVLFSTLLGVVLFREKLIRKNWIGIALAVASIVAVALSIRN